MGHWNTAVSATTGPKDLRTQSEIKQRGSLKIDIIVVTCAFEMLPVNTSKLSSNFIYTGKKNAYVILCAMQGITVL
jgi:hypothetical protein